MAMEAESLDWSSAVRRNASEGSPNSFLFNSPSGFASSSSLVLDARKGELVAAPVKLERKGASTERSIEALKNHSEAERRRRARINAHLDTLRSVIPGAKKVRPLILPCVAILALLLGVQLLLCKRIEQNNMICIHAN